MQYNRALDYIDANNKKHLRGRSIDGRRQLIDPVNVTIVGVQRIAAMRWMGLIWDEFPALNYFQLLEENGAVRRKAKPR